MIYIIGSISSGKTTLTKLLGKKLDSPYYLEDIDNGLIKGMLSKFYSAGAESRKQVSALLQVAFLAVRYSQLKKAISQKNAILDSNLLSDSLMAYNLYRRGEMDKESYNVYLALSQEMQSNVNASPFNGFPDLIIFLDISPEHEIEEIKSRGREIEDISKDKKLVNYYHSVNNTYHEWYQGYSQSPILRIDRDKYDFVNSEKDKKIVLNKIYGSLYDLGQLSITSYNRLRKK